MTLLKPQLLDSLSNRPILRNRQPAGRLERRIAHLTGSDQLMIEMALDQRRTRREIADHFHLSPGNVTRRLRRILNRLHDPLVVAIIENEESLSEEYRRLGIAYFLQDVQMADLARELRISQAQVRVMIEYIRGWYGGICAKRSHK
ncbi:MAG TPA: hypothetical protein VHD56_01940 [Tepidisphaeraceae bacterium]|nr:hypothetical protein [Tepidisphaeraceae bacterium]